MIFPQYISSSERTVEVVGMIDKKQEKEKGLFKDGKGYIDEEGYIWIYCGGGKPKNSNAYPYFWVKDGKKVFSNPNELMKKAFNSESMVDLSIKNVILTTKDNEQLYDEEEINNMNAASSFFTPFIYDNDDFLKKIIKAVILKKEIDINRLKGKTDEKYQLPNMKAALQNKTKMSVLYFLNWINLLGCDFEITILDNGEDQKDPLKYPVVYESNKDKISFLYNGRLIDLETNNESKEDEETDEENNS